MPPGSVELSNSETGVGLWLNTHENEELGLLEMSFTFPEK